MIFSNSSGAVSAMESARTGNYGEDYPWPEDEYCPVCGEKNPDYFYADGNLECIGCSGCITAFDSLEEI